jgi:hypothetical protein
VVSTLLVGNRPFRPFLFKCPAGALLGLLNTGLNSYYNILVSDKKISFI